MFRRRGSRQSRRLVVLPRVLIAVLSTAAVAHPGIRVDAPSPNLANTSLVAETRRLRAETWRWQRLMGARLSPSASGELAPSATYRRWVWRLWKKRSAAARRQAQSPPHAAEWQCIHGHEAAWNDPDPPYYGGLQMDLGFQRAWGADLLAAKGTADRWTPLEQMWVAERAYRSGLGFSPWPNTAAMCGLS
jgi:hypothetical protein